MSSGTRSQLCGIQAQPKKPLTAQRAQFCWVNERITGFNPWGNYQHSSARSQVGSPGHKAVHGVAPQHHVTRAALGHVQRG